MCRCTQGRVTLSVSEMNAIGTPSVMADLEHIMQQVVPDPLVHSAHVHTNSAHVHTNMTLNKHQSCIGSLVNASNPLRKKLYRLTFAQQYCSAALLQRGSTFTLPKQTLQSTEADSMKSELPKYQDWTIQEQKRTGQ